MRRLVSGLLGLCCLALLPALASAAIRTVDDSGGKDHTTIQACVNVAVAGDTCLVYPGTYTESVNLDGKQGSASAPFVLKCLYPAVTPLLGGAWADTDAKRCKVDGGGVRTYGIGAPALPSGSGARFWVVDGFYVTNCANSGGSPQNAGLLFFADWALWLRNNVVLNCGHGAGEDDGAIYIDDSDAIVIQNNILEWTTAPPAGSLAALIVLESRCACNGSPDLQGYVEFNELRLTHGVSNTGTWYYIPGPVGGGHSPNIGLVNRYNSVYATQQAFSRAWRQRDGERFEIYRNVVHATVAQLFIWIHENTDANRNEAHQIHHNTFFYAGGVAADDGVLGLQYQGMTTPPAGGDPTLIFNNIFESNVADASYAIESGFGPNTNYELTATDNVWHNFAGFLDPALMNGSGVLIETGTLNTDAQVSATTGCAAGVDNATYGANLDISTRPWRDCTGAALTPVTPAWLTAAGLLVVDPKPSAPTGLQ